MWKGCLQNAHKQYNQADQAVNLDFGGLHDNTEILNRIL